MDGRKRTVQIKFRVTEAERDLILEKMKLVPTRNMAAYLRKIRFLYNGIIIKHQKTEPTYTKTSLFLCEKRRFFMARREKGVVPIIYFEKERGKSF